MTATKVKCNCMFNSKQITLFLILLIILCYSPPLGVTAAGALHSLLHPLVSVFTLFCCFVFYRHHNYMIWGACCMGMSLTCTLPLSGYTSTGEWIVLCSAYTAAASVAALAWLAAIIAIICIMQCKVLRLTTVLMYYLYWLSLCIGCFYALLAEAVQPMGYFMCTGADGGVAPAVLPIIHSSVGGKL